MIEPEAPGVSTDEAVIGWESVARSASVALGSGTADEATDLLRELLVFGLGASDYAIPVERTREIVRMRALTRVPRCPDWLLGVVALRGEVVEVVDLSRRLGLGEARMDRSSRIIVLHGEQDRVTGILVDVVSEVVRVPEAEVLPAEGLEARAVVEMCRRDGRFVSVLDVDRVLGDEDV